MRKISKSRTDDDVISSTNGSGSLAADGEDQAEQEKHDSEAVTDDKDQSGISLDKAETKSDISEDTPKKTSKGKAKGKKKKTVKTPKKDEVDEEYEVEKVVGCKRIKNKVHYLIRWKGYGANSDTWEPESTLSCSELINKYNESLKENSKDKDYDTTPKGKKRKSTGKTKKSAKRSKAADTDDENDDENAEYEVERILEVHHKKNGEREFYIHWKGWSNKYDSWEPESNLNCPELIKKFMSKVSVARSTESRNLRVAPETTNRFTLQDPSSGRRLSKRRGQRQRVRYDNAE